MTFSYWIILFSIACFACMLGLNISDGLRSVVAIYIVVPFLLVPQILLAGVIVKFDKLHHAFANYEYVPVAGDIMASRWVYEALAVNQFANNLYQRHFYDVEMRVSNISYDMQFLAPTLIQKIEDLHVLQKENPDHPRIPIRKKMIIEGFASITMTRPFPLTDVFEKEGIDDRVADSALDRNQIHLSTILKHVTESNPARL